MMSIPASEEIDALIARSNRLGAEPTITNFAGGNTSTTVVLPDVVTGEPTAVLVVKGSGGDLGTLRAEGLAYLRLDRFEHLVDRFVAGDEEDDLVEYYAQCAFVAGAAVPSIDTPLHALVPEAHIDHLHPDAVIALAAAADGEALVAECYGSDVGWLDWQRPGFALGMALRDFHATHPSAKGAVLGGHGLICWADTSDKCEAVSRQLIARAAAYLAERGHSSPLGTNTVQYRALPDNDRRAAAIALGPVVRGMAANDRAAVGSFSDSPVVLDFLASERAPDLVALGTSCPDHFLRTKIRPLMLDLPPSAPFEQRVRRLRDLHVNYRRDYRAYYDTHATADSPAMRGADPAIVLVPGVGMWSFGVDAQTAAVAGEFYVNAINVMRGAESVSRYQPISDAEKFAIEYWHLEERKLAMKPPPPPLVGRVALITGGASGIGAATAQRFSASGAAVIVADVDAKGAEKVAASLPSTARSVAVDVADESSVTRLFDEAILAFGGVDIVVNSAGIAHSSPLLETSVDTWDHLHAVLARGSFLISRAAAGVMAAQGQGGDIVHVVSKNALAAGPANIAYSAAKADQAHQVRLLAAELGAVGIRVNGVNPDGVVQGSGIFSGDWRRDRAAAYGVEPDDLSAYYASRTLLGLEVLPGHVADTVHALVAGDLSRTTGTLIPVDGGLPVAFPR